MLEDFHMNEEDVTRDTSDPHAETHHDDETDGRWLESNVGVRADDWIGRRIGDFEIIRIIGIGGMGNVYEAKQVHPHRSVALKIVKTAAASPVTLQRFEMESELLARLQHPGIAQVYDSGHQTQDDILLPYFAMEYVPGSISITDYAVEEKLSRDGKLELFLRVCEAVQYGHGRGVIHRDLKPSNILITSSGRPKVIDFGVAFLAGSDEVDTSITAEGRFVGTLQWSSPEQCGDDPHDVDVRTDVYSLGMLMFQLMTGELPYDLKGIPLYRAPLVIRETKPKSPRSIDTSTPIEIEQILMKSLSKDRESRYESVAAFATDIRRYLCNQPILAKPPTAFHRLKLYAKRNQLKFRATIVVFLALILGVAGLIWGFVESEARQKDMKVSLEIEANARSAAEQVAYISTIGTAQAAIANGSWGMARHHLAATAHDQRGWEWHYLQNIVDQSIRKWPIGDRPTSLTTSPLGSHLAVTFVGGRVVLIDESRDITRDIALPSEVNSTSFSLNGKLLYLGMTNGNIAIFNLEQDSLLFFDEKRSSVVSTIAIDDSLFATGHSNGQIHLWTSSGEHVDSKDGDRGMVLSLDYDASNELLAIGTIDGTVQTWKLQSPQPEMRIHGHGGAVRSVQFLRNGTLVSGGDDGNILVWDLDKKTNVPMDSMHGSVMGLTAIGDAIASTGLDGIVRLWSSNDFTLLDTLLGHDDLVWSIDELGEDRLVTVGQDGIIRWWSAVPAISTSYKATSKMPAADVAFVWNDSLATVSEFDSDMQVFDIATNESHVISSGGSELTTVAFVPTSSFAVTGDLGGQIRLWNIDTMQEGEVLGQCEGQITALAVSRSGRKIAAGTLTAHYYVFNRRDRTVIIEGEVGDSIVLAMEFNSVGTELYVSTIEGTVESIDVVNDSVLWKQVETGSDIIGMEYVTKLNAILAATASKTLLLIDAKTGDILERRESTGGVLRDIELFQNETRFVTVSSDGTVGIWDTDSLNLVASLPSQQSLECVTVSRDGHRLAIGGGSATIQMMDGMSRAARLKNSTNEQAD